MARDAAFQGNFLRPPARAVFRGHAPAPAARRSGGRPSQPISRLSTKRGEMPWAGRGKVDRIRPPRIDSPEVLAGAGSWHRRSPTVPRRSPTGPQSVRFRSWPEPADGLECGRSAGSRPLHSDPPGGAGRSVGEPARFEGRKRSICSAAWPRFCRRRSTTNTSKSSRR